MTFLDDDEPPPLEVVAESVDWDLPDLEPVKLTGEEIPPSKPVNEEKIPALEPVPGTQPAPESPVAKEPATEEPATEKPAAKEPAAKEPAAEKPGAQESTPQPEVTESNTAQSVPEEPNTDIKNISEAVTSIPPLDSPATKNTEKTLDSPATTKKATTPSFKKSRSSLKAEELKNEGNVAIGKGDYDKAIELYSRAIALDRVNINREGAEGYLLYCNRAKAYLAKTPAKFKWALKDAQTAIKIKPDFAKAHYRAAVAYEGLGQEEKAIETFCKVAEFVPGDVSIAKKLSNLVHFKPDVLHMVTIMLNPSYLHCTAFLDITSAYICKLLSPKPAEYAKISKDDEKKDENASFEDQLKARQILFVEKNGSGVSSLLLQSDNKRLKHYGKKFQKIVNSHKS